MLAARDAARATKKYSLVDLRVGHAAAAQFALVDTLELTRDGRNAVLRVSDNLHGKSAIEFADRFSEDGPLRLRYVK